MKYFTILIAGILLALLPSGATALAQRVQFPTAAPAASTPYDVTPIPSASPAPTYGTPTYTTPTYTAPPLTSSPYAQPPAASAPYTPVPYSPAPYTSPTPYAPAAPSTPSPYAAPSIGAPPVFDPYASGGTLGPPPPTTPYTPGGTTAPAWPTQPAPQPYSPYGTPPPANSYPQQPGAIYPEGLPLQWQPTPCAPEENYWVKTQRFMQELSLEYTYLYGEHTDAADLEINRAELSGTFAVPIFYNIDTPLLVTPGLAVNWLEGPLTDAALPDQPDLPPRLYDAYLDFAWYPRVNQWLGAELGARTGVWSDMDHVSTDSIRLLGRGLASVSLTPQLDILFGAVYLDRLRVKLLPAGGFYWRPTPEWDLYVVFPNPKARKYFTSVGNSKLFWYVAGEYGGGSWTVTREESGISDRIDINDIRVIGGLEWETQTMIRGHVEVGYVWDREVLFNSGAPPSFSPEDTIMVRGGIDF